MQGSKKGQIPAARLRIIERIATQASRLHKRVGKIAAPAFAATYYRGVAEEDLRARDASDLGGAVIAHLKFGQIRKRGTPLVRVYSPEPKRDSYRSSHTVVEVVIDDMPFLVDSLGLIFAQQGLDVHITIHPVLHVDRNRSGLLLSLADEAKKKLGLRSHGNT